MRTARIFILALLAAPCCLGQSVSGVGTISGTGKMSVVSSLNILQQPQNQTVLLGQSTEFTVIASGVTTYQWQKNGTNIPGATSSSYLTAPAASTDNAASFRVV